MQVLSTNFGLQRVRSLIAITSILISNQIILKEYQEEENVKTKWH